MKFEKWVLIEWAHQDLNLERPGYEPGTLTN